MATLRASLDAGVTVVGVGVFDGAGAAEVGASACAVRPELMDTKPPVVDGAGAALALTRAPDCAGAAAALETSPPVALAAGRSVEARDTNPVAWGAADAAGVVDVKAARGAAGVGVVATTAGRASVWLDAPAGC